MADLLDRILLAHGGVRRWEGVNQVLARVSMGGAEFTTRLHVNPLRDAEVTVSTASPDVTICGYPGPDDVARFQPNRVSIESSDGTLLQERTAPGVTFHSVRHWLWWDQLDVTYYCGLSLWQAMCLPFMLLRSGTEVEELEPVTLDGERLRRLRVVLPADIPTLVTDLILHADATGLLRRLDYSPGLYGSWIRVAQVLEEPEFFDGFVHATRRHVHACVPGGYAIRAMPLGWIYLDDIGVARRAAVK